MRSFIGVCNNFSSAPPVVSNVTSFLSILGAVDGSGTASIAPPTHLAPTGTQKDLLVATLVNSVNGTVPTAPTGQGWNSWGTSSTVSTSALSAYRVIWKYCATNSEAFGSDAANATRAVLAHFRLTVAPSDPFGGLALDLSMNVGAVAKSSGQSTGIVRWAGHSGVTGHHIITLMLAKSDVTPSHRTDTTDQASLGSGTGKVLYGRSNGPVTSWAQQDAASSAATGTHSIAIPVIK